MSDINLDGLSPEEREIALLLLKKHKELDAFQKQTVSSVYSPTPPEIVALIDKNCFSNYNAIKKGVEGFHKKDESCSSHEFKVNGYRVDICRSWSDAD